MSRTKKVLLIEGNEAEAREIQALLSAVEDEPFVVEWVQELKHALNRLAKEAMDIVLLSLDLPDSQGVETFVTLHDRIPDVPIVVLAGEDHETIGPAAIEKGAHHYVARHEIDGDSLVRALYYALARHHEHLLKMQQTHHDESEQILGSLGAKGEVGHSNTGPWTSPLPKPCMVTRCSWSKCPSVTVNWPKPATKHIASLVQHLRSDGDTDQMRTTCAELG